MDADSGLLAAYPDDEQHHLYRLISSLRAAGGLGAIGPACHREMPGVDGVVLSVDAASSGRIILSDSGPHGDQLEDLHAVLGEGPCIDAAITETAVAAADLDDPDARKQWPQFAQKASARGILAVFAHPLLSPSKPFGVLSAYRTVAGPLSPTADENMRRYTRAVTLIIGKYSYSTNGGASIFMLPSGAGKVQQAVGVIMQYAGVDARTALHRLRAYAHNSGRPMQNVVADVRNNILPFDPTTAT